MNVAVPFGWIIGGYLGGRIVARKGYEPKYGIMLGCLGFLGLIIAFALPVTSAGRELQELENQITNAPKRANCPNCGKQIEYGSKTCPHCEYVIDLSRNRT